MVGLLATSFGDALVEHQLTVRDVWGEPFPACMGKEPICSKVRPLALVPGEGVPLLERFVELKVCLLDYLD